MANQSLREGHQSLGTLLRQQRLEQGLTRAAAAGKAGISVGYFAAIETGRSWPLPLKTLSRIVEALGFRDSEAQQLMRLAATERGIAPEDAALPEDAQALITEIRKHANTMDSRFMRGLRAKIREVVS